MKKSILISLGLVAALGASTTIYAYTSEQPPETNINESSISEFTPINTESNVVENTPITNKTFEPITVNIDSVSKDDIHIPLDLENNNQTISRSVDITNNPIDKLVLAHSTDWGTDTELRVIYALESGSEVEFYQSDIAHSTDEAIEYFKNQELYDPNEVSVININGFPAVVEDGSPRKTVHLITNDHIYTVVSIYDDVSIDYLLELAKEIKE